MCRHFRGLVERRGERHGCLQFRKILKWYFHFIAIAEAVLPAADQPLEPGPLRRGRSPTARAAGPDSPAAGPLRAARAGAGGGD